MKTPSFDPVLFPWKVKNFFYYFNSAFAPYVRRHHEAEEKVSVSVSCHPIISCNSMLAPSIYLSISNFQVYIPWVATRASIPDRIAADHASMDDKIKAVETSESEYKALIKAAGKTPDPQALYEWRSTLIMRLSVMTDELRWVLIMMIRYMHASG